MDSVYTRSGTRRLGDDYQDIVALETIVNFLEHKSRYQYILIEAPDKGSLDDIECVRQDDSLELKQVKYSVHPENQEDPWTWAKLTDKVEGQKSLIEKWAYSLEKAKKQGCIYEASVESNRRSDEIQKLLDRNNHVILDKIADVTVKNKIIQQIGGEEQAKDFFGIFRFNLNKPNLTELEESVEKRFFAMGVTQIGLIKLRNELRSWACEKNKPAPDGKITYDIIKSAVDWHELKQLNERFLVPDDFVVPSEDFHEQLIQNLKSLETGCIVITAPPGNGKSTYLSYLYNILDSLKLPVVRHYYYLSDQDRTLGRNKYQIVSESLMGEIKAKYPDFLGSLSDRNAGFNDFSSWLEKLGQEFRKTQKSLIIMLDGLDHVWRETQSVNELNELFEHIFPTPKGVLVLIGTQPIDDQKVPTRLLEAAPRAKWRQLPALDLKAVREWLVKHKSELNLPANGQIRNNMLDKLAESLHKKSCGLPLYLHYSIKKIRENQQEFNVRTIEGLPECPHDGIIGYYKTLLQGLCDEGKQILYLLATCPLPWNQQRIVECLEPKIPNASNIVTSIREVKHLLMEDVNTFILTIFHNSLYVFLKEQSDYSIYSSSLRPLVISWLHQKAPEYIRWQFLWTMEAEAGDEQPLIMGPNRKWVIDSITNFSPQVIISQILSRSALAALRKQNMAHVIEIGFLLDYYNDIFRFQTETLDRLFFAQMLINRDKSFTELIISTIPTHTDKQLLYFSERNRGKQALVQDCRNELFERQRGNRYEQYRVDDLNWYSLISSFIETTALLENIDLGSFVQELIKVESKGMTGALDIYCQSLRKNRSNDVFRQLLSLSLPKKDFYTVLRHAILLSFEEGFDLTNEVSNNVTYPFSAIYAALYSLNEYPINSLDCPSTRLFDSSVDPYSKKGEVVQTLYDLFFLFTANCLWRNNKRNHDWIKQVKDGWIKDFIVVINEAAEELSQLINKPSELSIDWLYRKVNSLKLPNWLGDDIHNAVYGECAEKAVNKITFDLFPVFVAKGRAREITKAELENAFSTQYCNPWNFIELLVTYGRRWLSNDALDWINLNLEKKINSSIKPFSERANSYSKLAIVFALHGNEESAKIFVEKAADNLLAYGDHKDLTLFFVLDSLKLSYKLNVPEAKSWLMETVPAILWVKEFTDGDETRHLAKELGDIISKYQFDILPSYYDWLMKQEDYYNATRLIHSVIENADLQDPINQAIVKTAIDEKSLLLLHKRATTDNDAETALTSIIQLLGENAIPKAQRKEDEEANSYTHSFLRNEDLPDPSNFPPERFRDYILGTKSSLFSSASLKKWIAYWKNTPQIVKAYESIELAVDKGIDLPEYDSLFELSYAVCGRTEAYKWLVKAQVEQYGWDRFSDRDEAFKRWEIIKKSYPEKWYEFIIDTLEPMFSERWIYVSSQIFARLVDYCFYMQQTEIATTMMMQAVVSASELVSPINLPKPMWVEENEPVK